MGNAGRKSSASAADFNAQAVGLLDSAARKLIKGICVLYVALQILLAATLNNPRAVDFSVYTTLFVILATYIALKVLPHKIALVIWAAGFALAILVIVNGFQQPAFGFFLILLPFLSTITGSKRTSLLTSGILIGLLAWDTYSPWTSRWFAPYGLQIIIGLLFGAAINWYVVALFDTLLYWSLSTQKQASEVIEKSREERLEFKQTQDDLMRANQELATLSSRLKVMHQIAEEGRQAKAEFVANVSHELRTPLNMIIGFSEMISQSPRLYGIELPPALLVDVATIQRNSQHLAKLVDDVLDLSQVDAGRMALSKEWVQLPKILEEASTTVKPLFDTKALYLEMEIADQLPPVFCDGTRIRQIVLNLLSNAIRFTEQGGVRIKAWRDEQQAVISITDTGPGIAAEDQARLFEPFQQVDGSIRRRYGGNGLGLNISKRFVEMHQGKMWLESQLNVGTTLFFSLPLFIGEPAVPANSAAGLAINPYYEFRARTEKPKVFKPTITPRFVLLEKGQLLFRWFERYVDDIEVIHVQTLDDALRELDHLPAQALIVNASGTTDYLSRLVTLELPYRTPILTCNVPGEVEAAERLGITRYLVKPVTREPLLSALESLGANINNVLLVDDMQEVLRLFSRMLAGGPRSYRVSRATNGTRALALMRERKPDAIVLDLIMPGMDGFRVLEEMKADPALCDIPVIVITSQDPTAEAPVSDILTVARNGGLTARDLVACLRSVSGILAGPEVMPAQPTH